MSTSLLSSSIPSGTYLCQPLHPASFLEFKDNISSVDFVDLVFLVSSNPSVITFFSFLLSLGFLIPRGKDLMETYSLGLSVTMSLTL